MRVVFDTHVLVSALALPGGQGERALLRMIEGRHPLVRSRAIMDEFLTVLSRKFGRDAEALARPAVFLADLGELVTPEAKLRLLKDEPDNRILECALAGDADVVVTADHAMLELGEFQDVRIVSLRDCLSGRPPGNR